MVDSEESLEIDDTINQILIDHVRERPTLHYTDTFTESDEKEWDEIQNSIGIQKSWLKRRWKTIRNDHRKITIYNHIHNKKVPPHQMAKNLDFFHVDINGANAMDFDEIKRPKKESFCITQEMIDNCDISENVTLDSISVQKSLKSEPETDPVTAAHYSTEETQTLEQASPKEQQNIPDKPSRQKKKSDKENSTKVDTKSDNSPNERCEDIIFGELVVAMLKKMNPEDKKRAKKEIMNILL